MLGVPFALAALATAMPVETVSLVGDAAYYLTDSNAVAGGAMAGTASVVGGGLAASSLGGAALAGAVAGGVVGVVAVGA
ncbi:hypothetical protein [Natronomonas sp. EA1]|uniref:hypothetical protein n=1 Tax=Natronomonas sp. EA1 TaxID=3421655 RepID=UPI003EB73C07